MFRGIPCISWISGLIMLSACLPTVRSATPSIAYDKPGRMIAVDGGSRLSMYCAGSGQPTVVLETGFGGGTYRAWHKLQPLLARITRTCSYDRAGYGFSELGDEYPRDLEHFVSDLDNLLVASGERPPYVLVGHSNGGQVIGTYAGYHPANIAGLVFLDAFYRGQSATPTGAKSLETLPLSLQEHLLGLRGCLARAENSPTAIVPKAGDVCLDSEELRDLPPAMARATVASMAKPAFWRSYLSEAECNYGVIVCNQGLRPIPADAWRKISIRVIVAGISSLDDEESARVYGLATGDHEAIAKARESRREWEQAQSRICEFTMDCRVERVATGNHYVQNAAPEIVVRAVTELITHLNAAAAPKLPPAP